MASSLRVQQVYDLGDVQSTVESDSADSGMLMLGEVWLGKENFELQTGIGHLRARIIPGTIGGGHGCTRLDVRVVPLRRQFLRSYHRHATMMFFVLLALLLLVLSGPTTGTKIARYREQRTAPGLDGKVPATPTDNNGHRRLRLQSDEHLSIAIARPFCPGQEKALVDSFADWSTFPLSEHDCQNYE